MHHVGTQAGRHDLGMGLRDMGWDIELFKIHESPTVRPIEQFRHTIDNVTEFLEKDVNNQGQVTVHIWLSLQFLHDRKPPHCVLLENTFNTVHQARDGSGPNRIATSDRCH